MPSKEKNNTFLDSFRPVFVVGASRSGTTMMGRIIGNSDKIFTFHELHFFEQLWTPDSGEVILSEKQGALLGAKLLSIERAGYLTPGSSKEYLAESEKMIATAINGSVWGGLSAPQIFEIFLRYETHRQGGIDPCDHTPRNVFYLQNIFKLYPDARVINMVRDPRNVLLSQKKKWRRRFLGAKNIPLQEALRARVNYHPIVISKLWCSAINAADFCSNDSRVHLVTFEGLVKNPEETVKSVCEFLKITYSNKLLDIPQIGSSNIIDQVRKRGVNEQLSSSYKNNNGLSDVEVFWCQKITGKYMKKYNYPELLVAANPLYLFLSLCVLPLQLGLALALNLHRMKSFFSAIKKRL